MGKRVTLDRVEKSAVNGEIIFNRDSDLAFAKHIEVEPILLTHTGGVTFSLTSKEFDKASLIGDVFIHYRDKHKTEPDSDSLLEFSLFATKEFADNMAEYGLTDFEKDYTDQDDYYEIDEKEKVDLIEDIQRMKEFVARTDFNNYYLIITYM